MNRNASGIVQALRSLYPEARCSLRFRSPYELLVATILSAQCTDACVNRVTPRLFERFPDVQSLAVAEPTELEGLIHATGFFRSKAKNLIAMAQRLVQRHEGIVPPSLDLLTELPGVGRKTANVVLGCAFGQASGVIVDTHVKRLSVRLGWTDSSDPVIVERNLMALIPSSEWIDLSHRLIQHGRGVCRARKPLCNSCELANLCPRRGLDLVESSG